MKTFTSLLSTLTLSTLIAAQSAVPTNSSVYNPAIPTKLNTVYLWYAGGRFYEQISPLTNGAVTILPQDPNSYAGIYASLDLTDTSKLDNFTTQALAYISCDPGDYPGNLGVQDVVSRATAANVSAIVFYSRTANFCELTGDVGRYTTFYSMNSIASSSNVYNYLFTMSSRSTDSTAARILTQNAYESITNGTGGYPYGNLPHGKTTAIAMIALYAVTGLITILFLIIIVTGAVRAHRHPERYGPRNIIGRPRQSRAKGLARAMLDTLPIVKFGEAVPPKPHGDVELAETASVNEARRTLPSGSEQITPAIAFPAPVAHEAKNTTTTERNQSITDSVDSDADSKQDVAVPIAAEADTGGQMCSICTDEFELGEDIRLLPCNHMFHPACVDPWLLDISGTCPLCRIDLNPAANATEAEATTDSTTSPALAPPLDPASGRRARVYRSLFGERNTAAPAQRASPQETVEALRRYREANRRRSVEDPAGNQAEQQRTRRFFARRHRAAVRSN